MIVGIAEDLRQAHEGDCLRLGRLAVSSAQRELQYYNIVAAGLGLRPSGLGFIKIHEGDFEIGDSYQGSPASR